MTSENAKEIVIIISELSCVVLVMEVEGEVDHVEGKRSGCRYVVVSLV